MAMRFSSFISKAFRKVQDAPVAFAFLVVVLVGTVLSYGMAKSFLYNEGTNRFNVYTKELRTIIISRVNRTIELPVTLAHIIQTDATKGELDSQLHSLSLESRYPGVRELGIYSTSNGGKNLKRLYRYTVSGEENMISEGELAEAVKTQTTVVSEEPFLLKMSDGDVQYVVLAPIENGSYLFMVFDATSVLSRLFIDNSIFNNINFRISDTLDPLLPLYESSAELFPSGQRNYLDTQELKIGLYPWSLTTATDIDALLSVTARRMPTVILFSGIVIGFLMFGILWALSWSRKNALLLAEKMTKNLRVSEEKYRGIFESLQDVYYRTNIDGMITTVSPSIKNYIGLYPEQLIGNNATAFYRNPRDRNAMLSELSRTGEVKDYAVTLVGANGKPVYCSLNARFLRNQNGEVFGVEGLLRDITDRKIASDAVLERTKELERLNNLMIGRELRMVELKAEIAKLKATPETYGKK